MIGRVTAIEAMAQHLASTDSSNARNVAAELATIYEQKIMLQRDTTHVLVNGEPKRGERYVTPWSVE